jgi:hypothetical protein
VVNPGDILGRESGNFQGDGNSDTISAWESFIMQNNARIGGILSIVAGAFLVFYLMGMAFMIFVAAVVSGDVIINDYGVSTPDEFFIIATVFYAVVLGVMSLLGILAIVGGIFAIRRSHWGLALAGAIAGTLTFFPCGIPAIIFVSIGKGEFETGSP